MRSHRSFVVSLLLLVFPPQEISEQSCPTTMLACSYPLTLAIAGDRWVLHESHTSIQPTDRLITGCNINTTGLQLYAVLQCLVNDTLKVNWAIAKFKSLKALFSQVIVYAVENSNYNSARLMTLNSQGFFWKRQEFWNKSRILIYFVDWSDNCSYQI